MLNVVRSALAGNVAPAPAVVPDPPVRAARIRRLLEYINYSEHIRTCLILFLTNKFMKLSAF